MCQVFILWAGFSRRALAGISELKVKSFNLHVSPQYLARFGVSCAPFANFPQLVSNYIKHTHCCPPRKKTLFAFVFLNVSIYCFSFFVASLVDLN